MYIFFAVYKIDDILYYIISYPILSYPILSYPILSYPIISYHIISYHIISYHILSYHIISYHTISYHIILYYIILYELWPYFWKQHCYPNCPHCGLTEKWLIYAMSSLDGESLGTAQLCTIHKEVLPSRFLLLGFVAKTAAQPYAFASL